MRKIKIVFKNIVLCFILFAFLIINVSGKEKNVKHESYYYERYSKININNISSWIGNNGTMDLNQGGSSGMLFPASSYKAAIFQSGFIFGGIVDNEIRVGGSTYNQGLIAGKILDNGMAENPDLPHVRIYRVRRDFKTAVKFKEAGDQGVTNEEIYLQYQKDWNEWPASDGAPFEDLNKNNIYEPEFDIPGIEGADQTVWYVANDLDSVRTKRLYGSMPIGIEMQVTVWAYNVSSFLNNIVFRKYKLINKSNQDVKDMYLCQWADPDIGDANDDLAGCDTLLNLGYAYNADDIDATYGIVPAAVGFQFLELPGGNNKMNSFGYFSNLNSYQEDPKLADYKNGTLQWYNLFKGLSAKTGNPFKLPEEFGGGNTKYLLSGNPFLNEGWLDNAQNGTSDRRSYMSAGPYNFPTGDTLETTIALIGAIGKDRLNSVRILKYYSKLLKDNFKDLSQFQYKFFPDNLNLERNTFSAISEIELNWNNRYENFHNEGYEFQGYNFYQLYNETNFIENGIKINVFDKKDGFREIIGTVMDPVTGMPLQGVIQKGNDSGLNNKVTISKDYITDSRLIKGKKYFYGVSSYIYNKELNKSVESPISMITVIFQDSLEGPSYKQEIKSTSIAGTGLLQSRIEIADPAALTGHSYKISLTGSGIEKKWNLFNDDLGITVLTDQPLYEIFSDKPAALIDGLYIYVYNYYPEINAILEIKYGDHYLTENEWDYPGGNWIWRGSTGNYFPGDDKYNIATYFSSNFSGYPANNIYTGCDFEIRFSDNEDNFCVNLINNKIISVPFELWNIGINTPEDASDDFRLVPFTKEYSDTTDEWAWYALENYFPGVDTYGISWSVLVNDVIDRTPGENGYKLFSDNCIKSGGAGSIYNIEFDIDPSAKDYNSGNLLFGPLRFNDYTDDRKPPPQGSIIRFITKKQFNAEDELYFTTPILNEGGFIEKYILEQNYPNPFNPSTRIRFSIKEEAPVKLDVFNILGQKVMTLVNEIIKPGNYEKEMTSFNLASGIYIYRLSVDGKFTETKKMILLK